MGSIVSLLFSFHCFYSFHVFLLLCLFRRFLFPALSSPRFSLILLCSFPVLYSPPYPCPLCLSASHKFVTRSLQISCRFFLNLLSNVCSLHSRCKRVALTTATDSACVFAWRRLPLEVTRAHMSIRSGTTTPVKTVSCMAFQARHFSLNCTRTGMS